MVNIPRSELVFRNDVCYALGSAGANPNDILFVDEAGLSSIISSSPVTSDSNSSSSSSKSSSSSSAVASKVSVVLVDHNLLAPQQQFLLPYVSAVLDHHKDEGLFLDASPRVITVVGSCASLVAVEIARSRPELFVAPDTKDPQGVLGRLLASAILLDTDNLNPSFGRATKTDFAGLAALGFGDWSATNQPQTQMQLAATLQQKRADTSHLTAAQCLMLDPKKVVVGGVGVAICSVPRSLRAWLDKDGGQVLEAVEAYRKQHKLRGVFLFTYFQDAAGFRRELALFARDESVFDALAGAAVSSSILGDATLSLKVHPDVSADDFLSAARRAQRKVEVEGAVGGSGAAGARAEGAGSGPLAGSGALAEAAGTHSSSQPRPKDEESKHPVSLSVSVSPGVDGMDGGNGCDRNWLSEVRGVAFLVNPAASRKQVLPAVQAALNAYVKTLSNGPTSPLASPSQSALSP